MIHCYTHVMAGYWLTSDISYDKVHSVGGHMYMHVHVCMEDMECIGEDMKVDLSGTRQVCSLESVGEAYNHICILHYPSTKLL